MIRPVRRGVIAAALLSGLLLVSSGCRAAQVAREEVPKNTVTCVLGPSSGSLIPYSPMIANRQIGQLVFRGLFDVNPAGEPVPDLVTEVPTRANGGISADGRSIRYQLTPGVTWHDGKPVNAADVVFTLGLIRDGRITDEPQIAYREIESVTLVDDLEFTVRLKRPNTPLAWRLVPFVLPKHLLEAEPNVASAFYWLKPVGCGPFEVNSTVPRTSADLTPVNAKDALSLRVLFASSNDKAQNMFDDAGPAVWVGGPAETDVEGEAVVSTASTTWQAWMFNVGKGSVAKSPFVRNTYLSLLPHEATTSVPARDPFGLPLQARSLATTPAVLAKLRAAGWRMNADKIMQKGAEKFFVMAAVRTMTSEESFRHEAVTKVMSDAGIAFRTYTLATLDIGGYYARDYLLTDEWDSTKTRFYLGMPYGVVWPFEGGDAPSWSNPYGANFSRVNDARLDEAYDELLAAGDPAAARDAWRSLGRRLNELDIVSWEYPEKNNILVSGVTGVEAHPVSEYLLFSASSWRLGDTAAGL